MPQQPSSLSEQEYPVPPKPPKLPELIEKWKDHKQYWHFEMEQGVERLSELLEILGYNDTSLRYGSPIESFLADNSGAIEAILNFIAANPSEEWEEALESQLPEDSDDLEDDDDGFTDDPANVEGLEAPDIQSTKADGVSEGGEAS